MRFIDYKFARSRSQPPGCYGSRRISLLENVHGLLQAKIWKHIQPLLDRLLKDNFSVTLLKGPLGLELLRKTQLCLQSRASSPAESFTSDFSGPFPPCDSPESTRALGLSPNVFGIPLSRNRVYIIVGDRNYHDVEFQTLLLKTIKALFAKPRYSCVEFLQRYLPRHTAVAPALKEYCSCTVDQSCSRLLGFKIQSQSLSRHVERFAAVTNEFWPIRAGLVCTWRTTTKTFLSLAGLQEPRKEEPTRVSKLQ